MRATTFRQASADFLDRLRLVVACVTDRPLLAKTDRSQPDRILITLGQSVPLRLIGGGRIRLVISIDIVGQVPQAAPLSEVVRIGGYFFQISEADNREILAYHWHPDGLSRVTTPHLHLSSRLPDIKLSESSSVALGEMHLPTGITSALDIVGLLISEFGVEPRREDWQAILSLR